MAASLTAVGREVAMGRLDRGVSRKYSGGVYFDVPIGVLLVGVVALGYIAG